MSSEIVPQQAVSAKLAKMGILGGQALALPPSVVAGLRWSWIGLDYNSDPFPATVIQDVRIEDGLPVADLRRAQAVAALATNPTGAAAGLKATLRLRAVARQRETMESDARLADTVYAEYLAKYPADAVAEACKMWMERSPFWPSLPEMIKACEWAMRPRRLLHVAIARALERACNPPPPPPLPEPTVDELREIVRCVDVGGNITNGQADAERKLAKIEGRKAEFWAAFH